jgi:RNA polymerase sigma-70 factor (ECF subfamily)
VIREHKLVEEIIQGNSQAFQPLIERYSRLVYTSVLKIVRAPDIAEDIAQEAFFQAFRSLASFRGESAFSTWLVRIAVNKALDYCRRQKALLETEEMPANIADDGGGNPEAVFLKKEEMWRLREQVLNLPPIYRRAIYDYYFNELTYKDIAAREGVSVRAIESRIYRAKAILRNHSLGGEGEDVPAP